MPAGTRLHHSSPGPGNGPGCQVPPGFLLCLPGKPSIQRQCWRDPVISGIVGWACRAAQAGIQPWLRGGSSSSQGSWQRLRGAVRSGVQPGSGLCNGPQSKGVSAGGFLNNTKPPRSPEQHQCHDGCIPAARPQHPHRFPSFLVPSQPQECVSSRSCRGAQRYQILYLPKDFAFGVTQDPIEAAVVGQSVKWLCRSQDTVTPE